MAHLKDGDVRYTVILLDNGRVLRAFPFKNLETARRLAEEEGRNPHRIGNAQHVVLWDMDTQNELFSTY
jgi:hypothetical protein